MKKLLSLVFAIIISVSAMAPFSALANETQELPIMMENPFFSGERYALGTVDSVVSQTSASKTYNGNTYYGRGREFYGVVKKGLLNHKQSIRVRFLSDSNIAAGGILLSSMALRSFLFEVMYYATEDEVSISCVDGDYLRYSLLEYGISSYNLDAYKNDKYYYTIDFAVRYTASEKELQQTDAVVNSFVNSVDTNKLSDYEIIKKIHDFICGKTTYEYGAVTAPLSYPYAFSAYGALVKGKCVCQGYALAFYRLCKELGYNVRITISDPNRGNHAWNIVELDGKYYFVDCTWDDQVFDEGVDDVPEYYYFLVNYASSKKFDNGSEHVLDPEYFDTEYFNTKYFNNLDTNDYDRYNLNLLSRSVVSLSQSLYTYDGTQKQPAVTVKSGKGNILKAGEDYTLSYYSNVNTGSAGVSIVGKSENALGKTGRHFVIKPSSTPTPWTSSASTSVTLSWNASGGAVSGYVVEQYKGGKWTWAGNTSAQTIKISNLSPSTKYSFRIIAYKDVSKRRFYGAYSATAAAYTKPAKVKGLKLKSAKKRRLKVSFKKTKCTGYVIQYSRKKNMKGAKEITLRSASKTSRTLKKLKSKKKYYVRVRAYTTYTVSGKTVTLYGKWSAKKALKIK